MIKTVPVTQYYKGRAVATYTSIAAAARLSGARANHISEVVSGDRNLAGGFSWKRAGARSGNVHAFTTTGQLVASFRGLQGFEAGVTSIPRNRVLSVLRGERTTAGGLVWVD